ncbi:Major facilitator superfamily transporter [Cordyceps militaris CM01]|uniref:Major facilitator superfamily transporter n=1 Tax=Cordyceps militaris (strain CM01) TaxID=983644 RepID=G3J3P7_CORMM|nr:Major facilitator superfamily transporter [Cordyceps militaris CM01]EGX95723.1 Major facilitator superfamily transporter [Cordyceps militaris CM01]
MAAAQISDHLAIAAPEKESIDPKEGVSASEPLVSDPSAPREPPLEKAAKPPSPRPIHGTKWVLVVVSLLASFLLYALDTTIVATIQPAIVDAFGHVDLVPWLGVSFALASAASTLIWSKSFGLFCAKKLFLFATALFMGASAVCGGARRGLLKMKIRRVKRRSTVCKEKTPATSWKNDTLSYG